MIIIMVLDLQTTIYFKALDAKLSNKIEMRLRDMQIFMFIYL